MGKKIPYLFKTYETEDYLKTVRETAEWINEQEVTKAEGIIWKTFPDGQPGLTGSSILSDTSFYAGSAGIGFFFLRLYQVTQDKKWLEKAELAADYLLSKEKDISFYRNIQGQIEAEKGKEHASKLYGWAFGYKIGPISEGQFAHALFLEINEQKYYDFAIRQADTFVEAGIEEDEKIHWSDARDIVGDAGGIVYLLQVYKQTGNKKYLETAVKAGEYIEQFANPAKNGGTYYYLYDLVAANEGDEDTIHVNFSHGSAGTAYLWAVLYEATGDKKYLGRAEKVFEYLDGIASGDDEAVLYPYQDHPKRGFSDERFYLGMCGGPIGSSFPYKKLYRLTGDEKYLDKVKKLAEGLVRSGVPEHLSWGYWGSKCLCCGGPGVLEYFADLYDLTGDEKYKKYAKRTADKLISDSYEEKKGRSFYGAWDRIDPARVVSYTGYYIGAAGAAGALLKYYSVLKNIKIADFFEYYL